MTGPIAYTLAIQSVQERHAYRHADGEDMGFKVSIIGQTHGKDGSRKSLFKNHYRYCPEPLLLPRFHQEADTPRYAPRRKSAATIHVPAGPGKNISIVTAGKGQSSQLDDAACAVV